MADEPTVGPVEVRRVESVVGETGATPTTRVDVAYEVGFELDGDWVPVTSISESRAQSHQVRSRDVAARAEAAAAGE